ncbi:MAG: aspartate/glutamate racemase family protein [Opitutaceae bacterium]|nr:aspartate/glutamate racemase family protein [Opitutaceae bacterium]
MRKLGIIAPIDGIACAYYASVFNADVQRRLGQEHSAQFMAIGFNKADYLLQEEKWWTLTQTLKAYIRDLARGGAEAVILCPLVWYRFFDDLVEGAPIPLFHPVDALEREMTRRGAPKRGSIGLVASSLSACPGALLDRFAGSNGREVILPAKEELLVLDGIGTQVSQQGFARHHTGCEVRRIIDGLRFAGAQSIVVGCAEIANLLQPGDFANDCYNLSQIHASAAADWMFGYYPKISPQF